MSSRNNLYQARVEINGQIKLLQFKRNSQRKAKEEAQKHGRVRSIQKVAWDEIARDIEKLDLKQAPLETTVAVYDRPIDMAEMIWRKRIKRRENAKKDKKDLDK